MASLADLLVASAGDVPTIVASDYPLGTFKGASVDGLDPLTLAALHSLFTSQDVNQILDRYEPVAEASPEGPWLVQLPGELIDCLVSLAPVDQPQFAQRWATTEPLQAEGMSDQDAQQLIGQLAYYAQTASFESMEVYLWIYR